MGTRERPTLTDYENRLLWRSLTEAVGSYTTRRASQLSGIPMRTVSDWAASGVVEPDYPQGGSRRWSYRDLVLIRMVGWLRSKSVAREIATTRVRMLKDAFSDSDASFSVISGDGTHMFYGAEVADRWTGQQTLGDLARQLLDQFDLFVPEAALGARRSTWGPDLVEPGPHTRILPWVMGGEPCVVATRIPTLSIAALVAERHLSVATVAGLYPGLDAASVEEAVRFERSVSAHTDYLSQAA